MTRSQGGIWHSCLGRIRARLRRASVRLQLPFRRQALRDRKARNETAQKWMAVILIEHMGDLVACEPIGRHLKQHHPDTRLFWFVHPRYRELLDHNPCVDEVLTVSCLGEAIRLAGGGLFDTVYNLHFEGRQCPVFGDIVSKPDGPAPRITMSNYYEHGSLLELYSHGSGLPRMCEAPRLHIPDPVRRHVDGFRLPDRFAAYHCRSNEMARDWPADRFAELARHLNARFDLASVEVGTRPALAKGVSPEHRDLCGRLSVLETAEVIRRARLFVGIDSGPAHLANANSIPGVVLLGHYLSFRRYMPYCGAYRDPRIARMVHADGPVSLLAVAEAEDAAAALLKEPRARAEQGMAAGLQREEQKGTGTP